MKNKLEEKIKELENRIIVLENTRLIINYPAVPYAPAPMPTYPYNPYPQGPDWHNGGGTFSNIAQ